MQRLNRSGALLNEVERLNWTLAAIGKVTSVLTRAESEVELFNGVCEAIVFQEAFDLAWVGLPLDDEPKSIAICASAGSKLDYLDGIKVDWDANSPNGNGPTGRAIRSGQTQFNNNMLEVQGFAPWHERARKANLNSSFCVPIRLPDGTVIAALVVYSHKLDAFGPRELELFTQLGDDLGFGIDVLRTKAAHKRAEAAAEQERLFSDAMMESMPGVIYSFDMDGRYLRWNRNLETVTGYDSAEVAASHPLDYFAPEDRGLVTQAIGQVFATGVGAVEVGLLAKDGRKLPYMFTGHRMQIGDSTYLIGVGIDISDRKAAERETEEHAARLQAMSRQLMEVQESERRSLSRELHDSVGQELAALNLNLTILRGMLPADSPDIILSRLDDSKALLEETSRNLRSLMMELRPPGLDELGLLPALREHGRRVAERAGIEVTVIGTEPEPRLPPHREIALFRIAQEALNNVVKHATANHACIELANRGGTLTMSVSDDGKGFDPAQAGLLGMGTTTMRERAEAVGADYRLASQPGAGTNIVVSLSR
jgi:PAS domain S-box-containing protein